VNAERLHGPGEGFPERLAGGGVHAAPLGKLARADLGEDGLSERLLSPREALLVQEVARHRDLDPSPQLGIPIV
jgi:hypothetical protein